MLNCAETPFIQACLLTEFVMTAQVELEGELHINGQLPLERDLQRMLAKGLNIDLDLAQIVSYGLVAEAPQSTRRQEQDPLVVQYKVWTSGQHSDEMFLAGKPANAIIAELTQLMAHAGNSTLDEITLQVVSRRNPGEVWEEEDRVYVLRSCPKGYLKVNASLNDQMCWPCKADSYSVSDVDGCVGICASRPCTQCPAGADCQPGTARPWFHFVPKPIKIGTRSILWATIKGMSRDHDLGADLFYEVFYDNVTGNTDVGISNGANPHDYVWEYVVECTDESEPCDPNQVPGFYLRSCPR